MTTISVLTADPELGGGIPSARLEVARRASAARVIEVPRGGWNPEASADLDGSGFGLLVVSGLLCRRVVQGHRWGSELLGPGDLLRPWDKIGEWSSIPTEADWEVIETARLAVLDSEFARGTAAFPQISLALIRRGMLRARYLAVLIAIVSQRRVETRLNMLFWHLADRFGRMRGDWVEIPVPLTHRLLGELVAARRPSVTTALAKLQAQGILLRDGRGWRLRGPVPDFGDLGEEPEDDLAVRSSA